MIVRDVAAVLEAMAPARLAESWDNVGLLVGDADADVARVLLAIDLTRAVLDEAVAAACQLVVAYHPVIFGGLKRVTAGSVVYAALRQGVAVYSPHTALDVADGGTNDVLADVLGLTERAWLRAASGPGGGGMGRVGTLVAPAERGEVFARIKAGLEVEHLLVAGPTEGVVRRAAVGAGSCGDLIDDALAAAVDVYLTGELRHHDAIKAAERGMTVVCALHSNSERQTLRRVKARLEDRLPSLAVTLSRRDTDPFQFR